MKVLLQEFAELPFPKQSDIVYVLCFANPVAQTEPIPFYVGESSRHVGRIGDYVAAKFSASTDFKVGEAVKHFRALGFEVKFMYKESKDRKAEEDALIKSLEGKSFLLLNKMKGYDYRAGGEKTERKEVQNFVDKIVKASKRG